MLGDAGPVHAEFSIRIALDETAAPEPIISVQARQAKKRTLADLQA